MDEAGDDVVDAPWHADAGGDGFGGAATAEASRAIATDLFLRGVTGVHTQHGLTTGDAEEAATKRALAGQAADSYVLASSEKIGVVSPYEALELTRPLPSLTDAQGGRLDAPRHTAPAIIGCE